LTKLKQFLRSTKEVLTNWDKWNEFWSWPPINYGDLSQRKREEIEASGRVIIPEDIKREEEIRDYLISRGWSDQEIWEWEALLSLEEAWEEEKENEARENSSGN